MRPAISHPNGDVVALLDGYFHPSEACQAMPWLDDILSGVLALRTEGDSGTRALSRKALFLVLQRCEAVSTQEVAGVLGSRYQPRTVERYAATARVASKAIAGRLRQSGRLAAGVNDPDARRMVDSGWEPHVAVTGHGSQRAGRFDPMRSGGRLNGADTLAEILVRVRLRHLTEAVEFP